MRRRLFVNLADYLRRQFAYDEWANREVLNAIRAAGGANDSSVNHRSLQLMSHILAAERVWLERLKQQPQSVPGMAGAGSGAMRGRGGGTGRALARVSRSDYCRRRLPVHLLQEQQGRAVDEHDCRRLDARDHALGLSSRADRQSHACQRPDSGLYRLHSRGAPRAVQVGVTPGSRRPYSEPFAAVPLEDVISDQ